MLSLTGLTEALTTVISDLPEGHWPLVPREVADVVVDYLYFHGYLNDE